MAYCSCSLHVTTVLPRVRSVLHSGSSCRPNRDHGSKNIPVSRVVGGLRAPAQNHDLLSLSFRFPASRARERFGNGVKAAENVGPDQESARENGPQENQISLVVAMQSQHSIINILDVSAQSDHPLAGARVMLLGPQGNPHSIYYEDRLWTGSYWDDLVSFIPLLPSGPIALLGLAGGSTARIIRKLYPSIQLHAWEIDGIVADMGRRFMNMSELEIESKEGGCLHVHIDDAFSKEANQHGPFSGIIVDLFSSDQVLPELENLRIWEDIKKRLIPDGRIIINCGVPITENEITQFSNGNLDLQDSDQASSSSKLSTFKILKAMTTVFPNEVNWRVKDGWDSNLLAMTGNFPNPETWEEQLADNLKPTAKLWRKLNL